MNEIYAGTLVQESVLVVATSLAMYNLCEDAVEIGTSLLYLILRQLGKELDEKDVEQLLETCRNSKPEELARQLVTLYQSKIGKLINIEENFNIDINIDLDTFVEELKKYADRIFTTLEAEYNTSLISYRMKFEEELYKKLEKIRKHINNENRQVMYFVLTNQLIKTVCEALKRLIS